jgi:DNA-binding CsgD family transcriptional regulator
MPPTPLGIKGLAAEAAIADICARGLPALDLFERVAERLRRLVPYSAGCWKPTDPTTLLFTGFAIEDPQPGRLDSVRWRFVENELLEPDFAKFRRLVRGSEPVTTLHRATHGEPERSARYRALHRELGFGAELRAVFCSGSACWGSVALVRDEGEPDFTRDEIAFVRRLCGHVALGLRLALLHERGPAAESAAPGMLVLDDELAVESLTSQAAHWLERFPADLGTGLELPAAVYAVARRARSAVAGESGGRPAVARVRLDSGRWLLVHAAALAGSPGGDQRIAVVLAPAAPVEITPLRLELHGVSERECDVARLLVRGLSTGEIAAALHITRHTVRDHVKAIYAKLEVRSRPELTAKLFDEHYLPALDASRLRELAAG